MCGIAGSYRLSVDVDAALDRIAHRGPDGRGLLEHGDAVHGHVRLALLDLSDASAQPFVYRGSTLSYNGELWNHRELRGELEDLGHRFETTGDTEVVAAALEEWREEALDRLDGMFAVAWSGSCGEHMLARDRWGKIPLYVRRHGDGFAWASERKGLDGPGLRLPPATTLDLRSGRTHRWWSPGHAFSTSDEEPKGEASEILELLRRGVRRRLVADAPVCCLVSGGLDSSLVLALAAEVVQPIAYTAVWDPESPDLEAARRVCEDLDVELREIRISEPTAEDAAAAVRAIEIPSKLCIPLARRIAADGFKACLSGEAADEIFGGYGNMAIRASRADDRGWREIRLAQIDKMARGNFLRCNKAFMAAGVECRLPFMERPLVEAALALGKRDCPPGKGLLKAAGELVLPRNVVRRQKETFQGASGVSAALASRIHNPTRFYNAEFRRFYGSAQ